MALILPLHSTFFLIFLSDCYRRRARRAGGIVANKIQDFRRFPGDGGIVVNKNLLTTLALLTTLTTLAWLATVLPCRWLLQIPDSDSYAGAA